MPLNIPNQPNVPGSLVCLFCQVSSDSIMKVAENHADEWSLVICMKCWGQTIRWSAAMSKSMMEDNPIPIPCHVCKRPYFKAHLFEIIGKDAKSLICDPCLIEKKNTEPPKLKKNILI